MGSLGLFQNQSGVDKSAAYGGNRAYGGTVNSGNYNSQPDCQADPYHNAWWTINASSPITSGGQYRLQVKTSSSTNE